MKKIELPYRAADLTGRRFGNLVADFPTKDGKKRVGRSIMWACRCDCGRIHISQSGCLLNGHTTSCGCAKKDRGAKFGYASKTHGLSQSDEWKAWSKMKGRCYAEKHPQYKDWGGRGIIVCDRWRDSFANFLADMGKKPTPEHSLDRFPNNNGNYAPGNVRWATRVEQNRNRRNNRIVTAFGETKPLVDFIPYMNDRRHYERAYRRINTAGWAPERAILTALLGR